MGASLPRCVLAAKGSGPRTVFAQEAGNRDGHLIHIDDAPNGKTGLLCPDCLHEVVARHGEKRRHSFAHWKGGDCVFAGETAVHRLAKDIIAQRGHLLIPALEIIDVGGKKQLSPATTMSFDEVLVERYAGTQRPDLIGIVTDRYGDEHRLMIEIHVTNPVYGRRKRKLALHGQTVMEIDLSKIDRDIDEEALAAAVLRDAPRKWVTHPRRDRLQWEADVRLKQEEDDRKRRQAHAILKREEREVARKEALQVQPALLEGKDAEQTQADLAMWGALEFQDVILAVKAEDRIFKVPGDMWRARVMSTFAPWLDHPEVVDQDFLKISSAAAQGLLALGWVKDAYRRPEKDFTGHGFRERDFVEDACAALLEGVAAVCAGKPGGSPVWALKNAIAQRWKAYTAARKALLDLSSELRAHGAELYHADSSVRDEVSVDKYLIAAAAQNLRPPVDYLDALRCEVSHGHPRSGRRVEAGQLERLGLRLVTEHGEIIDPSALVQRVAADKKAPLQALIDKKAKVAANDCRAHFDKLQRTWPELKEILQDSVVGAVMREGDQAPEFQIEVDMERERPQEAVEAQLGNVLRPARVLAKDLARALAFSESASDQATREWVFYTAAKIAAGSRDVASGLPGLVRDQDLAGIRDLMKTLHEKSHKHGYGEDFQRRALSSIPSGADRPLLELILAGHRVSYLKVLADVRQRSLPSPWIEGAK